MNYKPFPEINQYVLEKIGGTDVYFGEKFSFLKIFQHGLSYALNGWDRMLLPNKLFQSDVLSLGRMIIQSKITQPSKPDLKRVLIMDEDRPYIKENCDKVSMFFEKIRSSVSPTEVLSINPKKGLVNAADIQSTAFNLSPGWPDRRVLEMCREVRTVALKTRNSKQLTLSEKEYIYTALQVFLHAFRSYYQLISNSGVETVLFTEHYHKEGLIAACNVLGIQTVELQHGLIAENDIYYVYPSVWNQGVKQAFFPDKMVVFGSYWKDVLLSGCEWQPNQIVIGGEYASSMEKPQRELPKENIILICAQKNMDGDYTKYIRHLVNQFDLRGWKVIVKLHPMETEKEKYYSIQSPYLSYASDEARLSDLLQIAKIQISIYSTTLYDAVGRGIVNLSLQEFGYAQAYAAEMIRQRVAFPLFEHENPLDVYDKVKDVMNTLLSREEVYAPFQQHALHDLLHH